MMKIMKSNLDGRNQSGNLFYLENSYEKYRKRLMKKQSMISD